MVKVLNLLNFEITNSMVSFNNRSSNRLKIYPCHKIAQCGALWVMLVDFSVGKGIKAYLLTCYGWGFHFFIVSFTRMIFLQLRIKTKEINKRNFSKSACEPKKVALKQQNKISKLKFFDKNFAVIFKILKLLDGSSLCLDGSTPSGNINLDCKASCITILVRERHRPVC